jgi:hypothetical protein
MYCVRHRRQLKHWMHTLEQMITVHGGEGAREREREGGVFHLTVLLVAKVVEITNESQSLGGKNCCFFDMIMPDLTLVLPLHCQ